MLKKGLEIRKAGLGGENFSIVDSVSDPLGGDADEMNTFSRRQTFVLAVTHSYNNSALAVLNLVGLVRPAADVFVGFSVR